MDVSAAALGPRALTVRAWRDGDRMRPLGLGRHEVAPGPVHRPQGAARAALRLPVVETGGEIAWVAGVAVAERFAAHGGDEAAVAPERTPGG